VRGKDAHAMRPGMTLIRAQPKVVGKSIAAQAAALMEEAAASPVKPDA
jgi:hypothetical protein